MTSKLYGIGVGPGDPELLTIKAKNILERVDIIYTPVSKKNRDSKALSIISEVIDLKNKRIEKLLFPMVNKIQIKKKYWHKNSRKIKSDLKNDLEAAFITIGDPMLYSTYINILNNLNNKFPEIKIETIPGITSINAASARYNIPLAQKNEKLMVLPEIPDISCLENIIEEFDNIVVLKISKNYNKLIKMLTNFGLKDEFVFISKCGYSEEFITNDIKTLKNKEIEYLSLVICKQGKDVSQYISQEEY